MEFSPPYSDNTWSLKYGRKMVSMILFAKQKQRHRRREQTYGYQGGKGWGGMNQEIGIDIYTLLILSIK